MIMVIGLLGLIAVRGFGHFWPSDIALTSTTDNAGHKQVILGELVRSEVIPAAVARDNGFTIANGLRVPKPYASKIILHVIKSSGGTAISINDFQIEKAMREIAKKEGMLIAPEGAALWEAYQQLIDRNWLLADEKVLMLNTGNGYKYLENLKIS